MSPQQSNYVVAWAIAIVYQEQLIGTTGSVLISLEVKYCTKVPEGTGIHAGFLYCSKIHNFVCGWLLGNIIVTTMFVNKYSNQ
jgi:hypothetical protein